MDNLTQNWLFAGLVLAFAAIVWMIGYAGNKRRA